MELNALVLLLAQIAAVLLVSRGLGFGARALGQPLVIAEMVAGIVLGPSLFGWLLPQASAALFPASSMPVLKMLSQLGLVLFMFLVGVELDPKLLRGRERASVIISHSSIVAPFALGLLAAFWLHEGYAPPGVAFLPFALFIGISMSVTAFPVLARILTERGLFGSRVGVIAIACAAVDDVTAWCLLAVVVAIARAKGLTDAAWTVGLSLVFSAFMLYVARPLLRRAERFVLEKRGSLTPGLVAGALFLLLLSAALTEAIGIHALFGAFLFGAVLPREGGLEKMLAHKLESVAVLLLLPLFFAFSGLRTRIGLVSGANEWLVVLVVIALATLGKYGGSTLAARFTGSSWREASAIGVLMNTRGLMELIVLNVGLDLGVISPTLFAILVIMALVTTFATTPILGIVYPDSELRRDTPEAAALSRT
ncbi:MAG: putative cation transporter/universal stress family protein [Polyangiaceae bacterium]|nr:putative cation transporter/universal stress family protein [Polyangiaceae bacterium]